MSDEPAAGGTTPTAEPAAKRHEFDWREDTMGNYWHRCCNKGQTDPVHQPATDPAAEADR